MVIMNNAILLVILAERISLKRIGNCHGRDA